MTRKQADAAFDSLRRHSSAISAPSGPAEALGLLDRAVLTKLQRDAMVHYIAVGPDNLALAYSMIKAGAATFASVGSLAAGDRPNGAPAADCAGDREVFADRMIALDATLADAAPLERATRLLDAFTGHVAAGRERLAAGLPGEPPAGRPAAADVGAGDLLEAAGIAYVIGQLLESPPGR